MSQKPRQITPFGPKSVPERSRSGQRDTQSVYGTEINAFPEASSLEGVKDNAVLADSDAKFDGILYEGVAAYLTASQAVQIHASCRFAS